MFLYRAVYLIWLRTHVQVKLFLSLLKPLALMQELRRPAVLHLALILYPQSSIPALAYPSTHLITLTPNMALLARTPVPSILTL